MTTKDALDHLKQAVKDDPCYAWSWHCNLACAIVDEGVDRDRANRAAARFMQLTFGVNTKEPSPSNESGHDSHNRTQTDQS